KGASLMRPMKPWNSNAHPIQRLKNEIDGRYTRFFDDSFLPSSYLRYASSSFIPKCNIEDKNDHYLLEVEITGEDTKDTYLKHEVNTMTNKGERKRETKTENEDNKMHVVEQSYGSFYRAFTLPNNVNADQINAENKNGILFIRLPKNKESEPRRIDIN